MDSTSILMDSRSIFVDFDQNRPRINKSLIRGEIIIIFVLKKEGMRGRNVINYVGFRGGG